MLDEDARPACCKVGDGLKSSCRSSGPSVTVSSDACPPSYGEAYCETCGEATELAEQDVKRGGGTQNRNAVECNEDRLLATEERSYSKGPHATQIFVGSRLKNAPSC